MSHKLIYFGLSALCLAFLLWRGGSPERWCGVIMMVASVATPFTQSIHLYHGWESRVWLLDTVACLALWTVALRANRYWPVWVTTIQLCGVLGHLGALIDKEVLPSAYYILTAYGAYLIWPLMTIGCIRHQRRITAYREDPAWRCRGGDAST